MVECYDKKYLTKNKKIIWLFKKMTDISNYSSTGGKAKYASISLADGCMNGLTILNPKKGASVSHHLDLGI
jgi:hypothetical protein